MTLEDINRLRLDSMCKHAEQEKVIAKHKLRSEALNTSISIITSMNSVFIMSMLSGLYAEDKQ